MSRSPGSHWLCICWSSRKMMIIVAFRTGINQYSGRPLPPIPDGPFSLSVPLQSPQLSLTFFVPDQSRMPVLVTGANGRTSRHVIRALLSASGCPPLRLLVHSQLSKDQLGSTFPKLLSPPHDIVIADYLIPETLAPAFQGITTVFHNGPSFHPLESTMGIAVIDAAKESNNTPHFVLCSVFQPFRGKLLNHKSKMLIEEYLIEAKIDYTILQPTQYMQNVSLATVRGTGILRLGYSPSVMHGFLDLMDLAQVARKVILSPKSHILASYELIGQNLSYSSVMEIMSKEMRRSVTCEILSPKEFAATLVSTETKHKEYAEDAAQRMVVYYDRWGLTGNSNTLEWLLNRKPTTWNQYLRRELSH